MNSARSPGGARRCGWFDAVALRRAVIQSSVSGLCVTKLDVLDGLQAIRICTAYRYGGAPTTQPPLLVEDFDSVEPVYEELPGWQESTVGLTAHDQLPAQCAALSRRACRKWSACRWTSSPPGPDRDADHHPQQSIPVSRTARGANVPKFPNTLPFVAMNRPLRIESSVRNLEVEGTIPPEVKGAFFRAVPDPAHAPLHRRRHHACPPTAWSAASCSRAGRWTTTSSTCAPRATRPSARRAAPCSATTAIRSPTIASVRDRASGPAHRVQHHPGVAWRAACS